MTEATDFTLSEGELQFTASRSGGPGGQNVNKVSSKVTIGLDLGRSAAFTPEQKERIRRKLATRINADGVLKVTSQKYRTQAANREAALARLIELLVDALREVKPRRKVRPSRAAKEKRIEAKHRRAKTKKQRSAKEW
jgi:ribosome-associated protein